MRKKNQKQNGELKKKHLQQMIIAKGSKDNKNILPMRDSIKQSIKKLSIDNKKLI